MRPFLKPRSLWCRAAQINSILIDDLASELISQKLPHFAFELPVGSMEAPPLSTTVPCRSIPALVAVETSAPSVTASTIARVDLRGARVDLAGDADWRSRPADPLFCEDVHTLDAALRLMS